MESACDVGLFLDITSRVPSVLQPANYSLKIEIYLNVVGKMLCCIHLVDDSLCIRNILSAPGG